MLCLSGLRSAVQGIGGGACPEVVATVGMIPESDGLVNRCSRISLGRSVVDMDVIELIKESCCCKMNEDMSLEPRRPDRAT